MAEHIYFFFFIYINFVTTMKFDLHHPYISKQKKQLYFHRVSYFQFSSKLRFLLKFNFLTFLARLSEMLDVFEEWRCQNVFFKQIPKFTSQSVTNDHNKNCAPISGSGNFFYLFSWILICRDGELYQETYQPNNLLPFQPSNH